MAKRPRKKKYSWGGKRPGAGRPALFEGDRVKMTIKITTDAKAIVDRRVSQLEPQHGALATESAAVEDLIRAGGSDDDY